MRVIFLWPPESEADEKKFFCLWLAPIPFVLAPSLIPPRSIVCLRLLRNQHKIEGVWTSILTLHADKSYAVLSWLAKFKPKILYQWRDATAGPLVLSADESLNQSNNQSANPCRDTSSELNFAVGQSAVCLGKNKLSVSRKSRLFYQNSWCIGLEPKLCVLKELVWTPSCLNTFVLKLVACVLCILYRSVHHSEALCLPGVKAYIGVDDVPGQNATGPVIFDEEVFASERVHLHWDSVTNCIPSFFKC